MQGNSSGGNNEFDQLLNEIKKIFSNAKKNYGDDGGSGNSNSSVIYIALIVLLVFLGANSFYTIDSKKGEKGVLVRLGKFSGIIEPGPHFKIPFVDQVHKVKVSEVRKLEFGYRASDQFSRASVSELEEESLMLTGDLNIAQVRWTVHYSVGNPEDFIFRFRASDLVATLRDVSVSVMRRVVGDKSVDEVLTIGKTEIVNDAKKLIQEIVDSYKMGVIISTVKLKDALPPPIVQPAFNEVNTAKQEQEQAINNAEREYNKIIPVAKGNAEKKIANAKAYSIDIINRSLGEASRFESMLFEYKKAPEITKKRFYLDTMQSVFTSTNSFTVIDSKVKGMLPVFTGNPSSNPLKDLGMNNKNLTGQVK